ncbi:substrate-binding domain-containing protein [Algoriphagus hitonicola]|uniref:substrate-binding domain-containing protein n=1 Tax=Algoriphagus hitonicola TaxID=435880 RepID=UPI00360BAA53
MKVISFSNMSIPNLLNPSLTTITQPAEAIGQECAKILIKKLTKPRQPDLPNEVISLPSQLTIRESTLVR